jgi:hypothetical protein
MRRPRSYRWQPRALVLAASLAMAWPASAAEPLRWDVPRAFMSVPVPGEQTLFRAPAELYRTGGVHFGSRFVFDGKGHLFFSIGERGQKADAQDLSRPNGKVHRIHEDGSIPKDNPFVGREVVLPSIWSYGNRNPQGLARHPVTGELWETEHGPRGGDELNRLVVGGKFLTRSDGTTNAVFARHTCIDVEGTDIYAWRDFDGKEEYPVGGSFMFSLP